MVSMEERPYKWNVFSEVPQIQIESSDRRTWELRSASAHMDPAPAVCVCVCVIAYQLGLRPSAPHPSDQLHKRFPHRVKVNLGTYPLEWSVRDALDKRLSNGFCALGMKSL